MKKVRLDALLVERGLAKSIEHARAIIMSGSVFIGNKKADKPGMLISAGLDVEVRRGREYVSRGGRKLQSALEYFAVSPEGRICIDCGASTGGFTDCLLKNGARLVYAIDVAYGQLAWSVRNDPRVVTMERTNIRYVTVGMFEIKPDLAAIDVSFISLARVLPVMRELLPGDGEALCLIKPQFEADREKVGKKGVVRDPETHRAVLNSFMDNASLEGFYVRGLTHSPLRGPEGNIEYFGWLHSQAACDAVDIDAVVLESHRFFGLER